MQLNADNVGKRSSEWEKQLELIRLPRDLMGGTSAMRAAGERYLSRRVEEESDEYNSRLSRAVLLNEFKRTVNFSSGQVFQKQVRYQELTKDEEGKIPVPPYNEEFFLAFQEDVDTRGTNLSMYTEKVFRNGVIDGIVFVLAEYPAINQRRVDGRLEYKNIDGEWMPRTAQADIENGWRPYFVLIRADQVLDAWLDIVNGKSMLRAFRYGETVMREVEGGDRVEVRRVRAIFPDRWEVWESENSGAYEQVEQGVNSLGIIPVDWFRPGEELSGLTAQPALDDLAWMNLAHWQAYSDHKGLMQYGRAPVWFGRKLRAYTQKGEPAPLVMGAGRFITSDEDGAALDSRGVDPASIEASFKDLQRMEEYMSLYGLQLITQQAAGGITATQANIAAASADSTLGGWVQLLQDCMENALRKIALWMGDNDGPALFINSTFRLPYDASAIQQEASQVRDGLSPLSILYELKKKMGVVSEDMTFEKYVALLDEDRKRNEQNIEAEPPFENFGGGKNNNQQKAPGLAQ